MTDVRDLLPKRLTRVIVRLKGTYCAANEIYIFNPLDKTFRTKSGKNRTSRVIEWKEH